MAIKTLIIDDEPLARDRIRDLLETDHDIDLVGEAGNGEEANEMIAAKCPDLLFLDIQMPDYDGFQVLSKMQGPRYPVIVFVTAYDQFAIQAFEINALDYLLKPFDDQRFRKSLHAAKVQVMMHQSTGVYQNINDLVTSYQWEQELDPRTIPIKQNGIFEHIPICEIYWIEAQGNYVKLQMKDRWHMYRATLMHMTAKLKNYKFLRIHRRLLVNTNYVSRIKYLHNNEYQFNFTNDAIHHSSRSYKPVVSRYLKQR